MIKNSLLVLLSVLCFSSVKSQDSCESHFGVQYRGTSYSTDFFAYYYFSSPLPQSPFRRNEWDMGDGGTHDDRDYSPGANGFCHTYGAAGTYRVRHTVYYDEPGIYNYETGEYEAGYHCASSSEQIVVVTMKPPKGQEPPPAKCYLKVFPNPANDHITAYVMLLEPQRIIYEIHDVRTRQVVHSGVSEGTTGDNNIFIDIDRLDPGMYVLNIHSDNRICTQIFIKDGGPIR